MVGVKGTLIGSSLNIVIELGQFLSSLLYNTSHSKVGGLLRDYTTRRLNVATS